MGLAPLKTKEKNMVISLGDIIGVTRHGLMLHEVRGWLRGSGMVGICSNLTVLVRTFDRDLFQPDIQRTHTPMDSGGDACDRCTETVTGLINTVEHRARGGD